MGNVACARGVSRGGFRWGSYIDQLRWPGELMVQANGTDRGGANPSATREELPPGKKDASEIGEAEGVGPIIKIAWFWSLMV
jgi:hypothetical protein